MSFTFYPAESNFGVADDSGRSTPNCNVDLQKDQLLKCCIGGCWLR